ncbi:MAG: hypothetical protein CYPHOPRED_002078 [Cyphobasidiales sp. Tagirdzhanova-0007]|nr:MAG: hypothetical protein CYPHOPRED_002078 [Cyphobasidiales sp. Tagirdzhanova-0007]
MLSSSLLHLISLVQLAVAAPLSKKQEDRPALTLGFSQRRTASRHGQSLRSRAAAVALSPRQIADDDQQLYNLDDARYIVNITLAGQELQVILDSGSTDTYVYSVQPSNQYGDDPPPTFQNQSASPLYNTGLTYSASYGSGNGITTTYGAVQMSNILLDGSDFRANNLSFANVYSTDNGVGASGLLGLGFPLNGNIWTEALTAIYASTKTKVSAAASASYFPIVPLLQAQGAITNAMYSLVVTRLGPQEANNPKTSGGTIPLSPAATLSTGTLTIGNYPAGMTENQFTWSAVPTVTVSSQYVNYGFPASTGNRWTTQMQAVYFNGAKLINSQIQPEAGANYALIDTGNPIMGIASDQLAQITNAWAANPDNYVIPCDTAFDLVFQVGGVNFTMNATDVLVPSAAVIDSGNFGGYATSDCQAQMQPFTPTDNEIGPDTSQTYQLGDVFLRNVITVFDYGSLTTASSNPPRLGFYSTTSAYAAL